MGEPLKRNVRLLSFIVNAIRRIIVPLLISAVASVALLVGAGMAGGACHCMTPMFTLFPYGSSLMMHFSSDAFGLPLALLQFPFYVVVLLLVKGVRWKIGVLLLLVALHIAAASLGLREYCSTRRTCFFTAQPNKLSLAGGEQQRYAFPKVRCLVCSRRLRSI